MHIPPVLRSGLGGDVETKIAKDSPLGQRLISIVFVLINRAAKTAALYCNHSKRTMVTEDDVKCALKYNAITFFSEAGFESLEQDVQAMEEIVNEFVTEEASSGDVIDAFCDDESTSDEEEDTDEEDTKCTSSPQAPCDCTTCSGV